MNPREGITTLADLVRPGTIAVTNYAGSIGSQVMESWTGFNLKTVVPSGGGLYDKAGNDGEDWFDQNHDAGNPCQTVRITAQQGSNIRSDCPTAKTISGVFARCTWSAKIEQITDGTSNTIAMGEIRPSASAFQWIHGWTLSEGLWFATTAPINFNTDRDEAPRVAAVAAGAAAVPLRRCPATTGNSISIPRWDLSRVTLAVRISFTPTDRTTSSTRTSTT